MGKITSVFLQSLLVGAVATAGAITISVVESPIFQVPPMPNLGAGGSGSACVTRYMGVQSCVAGSQMGSPSTSASIGVATSTGSAQASMLGPPPVPGSAGFAPFTLTTQGQLNGTYPGSESSTASLNTVNTGGASINPSACSRA